MAVPKQRGAGSYGGDRHRSNKRAFRASGGSVKPPSKGCLWIVIVGVGAFTTAGYGIAQLIG